jgi:hypothetical protein
VKKQVPIMFTREMMIANLAGIKTQTRRPLKIKNLEFLAPHGDDENDPSNWGYLNECGNSVTLDTMLPAQPGDILCARETMRVYDIIHTRKSHQIRVKYEADGAPSYWIDWPDRGLKELPKVGRCLSNGGPREFWRFKRPLTSVRVERIRDISGRDVLAEGVDNGKSNPTMGERWEEMQRVAFSEIWNAIYPGSWQRNDWVVVYEYARQEVNQ